MARLFGRWLFFSPPLNLFIQFLRFSNEVIAIKRFLSVIVQALQHRNQLPILETKIRVYLCVFHPASLQIVHWKFSVNFPYSLTLFYFEDLAITIISVLKICRESIENFVFEVFTPDLWFHQSITVHYPTTYRVNYSWMEFLNHPRIGIFFGNRKWWLKSKFACGGKAVPWIISWMPRDENQVYVDFCQHLKACFNEFASDALILKMRDN